MALAAALVTDADLLLLDEPTNHLDIEGDRLAGRHISPHRRGALVVVTHDRWFLDAVATLTWEVVDGDVLVREGGYSDWVFARAERLRLAGPPRSAAATWPARSWPGCAAVRRLAPRSRATGSRPPRR